MERKYSERKLFPLDKNHLLKDAQYVQRNVLLALLIKYTITSYFRLFNSLGIEDETTSSIKRCKIFKLENLYPFYKDLAGIYRYKYGENQLELLFDGTDHLVKFQAEWGAAFKQWAKEFCESRSFIKSVIEAVVLYPEGRKPKLVENRFKVFLGQKFELKVYIYKGIQDFQIA